MFEHENFEVYEFTDVPVNTESYLIDECYIEEYERAMLDSFSSGEYTPVGYISFIVIKRVTENSLELSWYPGVHYRFHEVSVTLPRDQFVKCVGCSAYSERPHFFVKSSWLEHLFLRQFSIFCMVDAINVKEALRNGDLTRERLIKLRNRIDELAERYHNVSFISFADSLIIKSNWTVGHFKSEVSYTYDPEVCIQITHDIKNIYKEILDLDIYAIFTQGSNEYYEDPETHISKSGNHICLNSLGAPFAQLMEIDHSARFAIKEKIHEAVELYLDEQFLYSLNFKLGFDRESLKSYKYYDRMTASSRIYFCVGWEKLLSNLMKSKIEIKQ